jgi:hypothetical protein
VAIAGQGIPAGANGSSLVRSALRYEGVFERMNHVLIKQDRQLDGREASTTAAILDSQCVKTTESGKSRGGYLEGTKIKGRIRHALVDSQGSASLIERTPPMCSMLMAAALCCKYLEAVFPSSASSGPTAAITTNTSPPPLSALRSSVKS